MASSGSVDSGGYQGRVIRFSWSTISTSGNKRTISYSFTAVGGSSSIYYHHNEVFKINGNTVYTGSSSHSVKTGDVLKSGTMEIDQNSTTTLSVQMNGGIYSYSDNISKSQSWTLDTLIQAPTINSLIVKSRTLTSITFSFTCSRANNWYYKLSSASDYTTGSTTNVTSGEFTISNLSPNTSYTINFVARNWAGSTGMDSSKNITGTTLQIATFSSVPNVNIGSAHTITWTNPSEATTSLKLCKTDGTVIEDYGIVTGTSKTINPNAATIYALTPNSNTYTARYIITTTYEGNNYTSYTDFVFTVTNSNPTIGDIGYEDANSQTVAVTQNNKRIVRNKSILQFILGAATPKNSATITKYSVKFNDTTMERTTPGTLDFGTINVAYNTKAVITVTDSRGNIDTQEITVIIDDWELPSALISLERLNNYEDETYLTVDANYSSVNGKNQISIKFQYKKTSESTYSQLYDAQDNIRKTISLSKEYSWDLKVIITDSFGSTTYENIYLAIGMPMVFYDTNLLSLGINCFPSHEKSLEINNSLYIGGIKVLWIEEDA